MTLRYPKLLATIIGVSVLAVCPGCCFNYSGTRWPIATAGTTVVYKTNNASIRPEWRPAIAAGASRWTQANGGTFTFVDGGTTFAFGTGFDGTNTIYFDRLNRPGVLAVTTTFFSPSTCLIAEADMAYNSDIQVWSPPSPLTQPQAFDVETVGAHEFGHMLRLAHTFWPRSTLMAPTIPPNTSKPLHSCDILGINCIYTLQRCRLCKSVLCPAMMAATADSVSVARQFADNILPTTPRGRDYRAQFAARSDEAVGLLLTNANLGQSASNVLSTFAPYLDAYMKATDLRFVVFSAPMYQQIADFVTLANASASPELSADLANFQSQLQPLVGLTFQEVIDNMLGVSPPPPPPPEPEGCRPGRPCPLIVAQAFLTTTFSELSQILSGDDLTSQRVQTFLDPRINYLQDYLQGGQLAASVFFTQADYNEANQILQAIRVNASVPLQAQIDRALQYLASRIGSSYKVILDDAFAP